MRFLPLVALAIQAVHAVPTLGNRATNALVRVTSQDGKCNFSACVSAPSKTGVKPASISAWSNTLLVNEGDIRQVLDGIGTAITDSSVAAFGNLTVDEQNRMMNFFFTPAGANFNIIRHSIGNSDLSDAAYSYNDIDNSNDATLPGFNLTDRGCAMARFIAKIKFWASNPGIKVVGTPWTPPQWMKIPNTNFFDQNKAPHYANYFLKYIATFKRDYSVTIDTLALQNEPLNNGNKSWTMFVSSDDAIKFTNYFAPQLQSSNPNTAIWLYDHNTDNATYPDLVYKGTSSNSNVKGVAWHCYWSTNHDDPYVDWSVMSNFYDNHNKIPQYMTECWTPDLGVTGTRWNWASNFARTPLQNRAAGIMSWPLATFSDYNVYKNACPQCKGLFVTNKATQKGEIQLAGYQLAQYSRYMPRGAKIYLVGGGRTDAGGKGMQAVASLNPDGSKTVVIENTYEQDYWVTVQFSSNSEKWSGQVKGPSVTTWNFS